MQNIKSKWAIFGFIFSLVYIFLEITFNLGLIDFINSKNTEISTFNKLETLGRVLSSIGFSLFITKLLLSALNKINKYAASIFFALVKLLYLIKLLII